MRKKWAHDPPRRKKHEQISKFKQKLDKIDFFVKKTN